MMATHRESPRFIAVTRIKAGREQEFEGLMPVIAAAHEQARPHLGGQWQLLRPDLNEKGTDGEPVYLFLFYGDVPLDDWELDRLLIEAHGEEEGQRLSRQFDDCCDGEQEVYAFAGEVPTS